MKKGFFFSLYATLGFGNFAEVLARTHRDDRWSAPKVAIIIDDIGYNPGRARAFFRIGVPLTFSILPRLIYSKDLMFEAFDQRHEVMLHQPMEPYSRCCDPGPGALYTGFRPEQIAEIISENLSEVPFAAGVNNHMGSLFTTIPKDIGNALQCMKSSNLYFIDSLTSYKSVAFRTAKHLHMTTDKRNVFLDVIAREEQVLKQLFRLKRHAQLNGYAIGIGHPFKETANAIRKFVSDNPSGLSFVHVSNLLY